MFTSNYDRVRHQFDELSAEEQDRLLRELADRVAQRRRTSARHSILELRGLGKEVWEDIDATEYVRRERAAWDG